MRRGVNGGTIIRTGTGVRRKECAARSALWDCSEPDPRARIMRAAQCQRRYRPVRVTRPDRIVYRHLVRHLLVEPGDRVGTSHVDRALGQCPVGPEWVMCAGEPDRDVHCSLRGQRALVVTELLDAGDVCLSSDHGLPANPPVIPVGGNHADLAHPRRTHRRVHRWPTEPANPPGIALESSLGEDLCTVLYRPVTFAQACAMSGSVTPIARGMSPGQLTPLCTSPDADLWFWPPGARATPRRAPGRFPRQAVAEGHPPRSGETRVAPALSRRSRVPLRPARIPQPRAGLLPRPPAGCRP